MEEGEGGLIVMILLGGRWFMESCITVLGLQIKTPEVRGAKTQEADSVCRMFSFFSSGKTVSCQGEKNQMVLLLYPKPFDEFLTHYSNRKIPSRNVYVFLLCQNINHFLCHSLIFSLYPIMMLSLTLHGYTRYANFQSLSTE